MRIIPRAEWGARYANGFGPAPLPAREVWLHHSVTNPENGSNAVRRLESIGQQRFGGGISYTFVITPDGSIYEGHSINRQGAHTRDRNSIARAIVLVGDYTRLVPAPSMVASVVELLRYGFNARWWNSARLTGGHRDAPGANTACPGDAAYRLIPLINQQADHSEDTMNAAQEAKLDRVLQLLAPVTYTTPEGKSFSVDPMGLLVNLYAGVFYGGKSMSQGRSIVRQLDDIERKMP